MTERYDQEEDRANDVETHDNPDHQGVHSYEVDLQETQDQLDNWQDEVEQ